MNKADTSPCPPGADILVAEEMATKTPISQTPCLPDGGDGYGENQSMEHDEVVESDRPHSGGDISAKT